MLEKKYDKASTTLSSKTMIPTLLANENCKKTIALLAPLIWYFFFFFFNKRVWLLGNGKYKRKILCCFLFLKTKINCNLIAKLAFESLLKISFSLKDYPPTHMALNSSTRDWFSLFCVLFGNFFFCWINVSSLGTVTWALRITKRRIKEYDQQRINEKEEVNFSINGTQDNNLFLFCGR